MNAGIIGCSLLQLGHIIARATFNGQSISMTEVLPSKIYDINQLEGMRLAQIAWNTRQQSTVDAKLMMINDLPRPS
jgi:hypothetical protein